MGTTLWWAGNAVVVLGVLPLIAYLAWRIIRALGTVQRAVIDIRASLTTVAGGIAPATKALSDLAHRCDRLTAKVPL